jgi:4-hydroxy-tetrahydrodipicolinate synthase
MVGSEEILSEFVLMGGHGGVVGGANIFPKLYVDLYNASVNRDFEMINLLKAKVMQVCTSVYNAGHYGSSYLKGLKCALSIQGICDDFMAEPFHRFKENEREKIKEALSNIGLQGIL